VSTDHRAGLSSPVNDAIGLPRQSSLVLILMGLALIVLGAIAIGCSFVATLATVLVFGVLLLIGAAFQFVSAFWGRQWKGFFVHLLVGVLYLIAGMFMIENPVQAALSLTLLVAACLLVGGVFRIIMSLVDRFHGWGWVLLSGVISVFLGMAIWRQWPFSGLWVIGLFVGIEMIFSGMSWLMLGMVVRSAPRAS